MGPIPIVPAHAYLPPSAAARWSRCPGSPLGVSSAPSWYSAEGSAAHERCSDVLGGNAIDIGPRQWSIDGFTGEFQDDDYEAMQEYIDHCRSLPGITLVEQRVTLEPWLGYELDGTTPIGGTCDFASITDEVVYVRDLKFGKGERVDAENNEQMILYALGVYNLISGLGTVRHDVVFDLGICQPRIGAMPDPARPVQLTLDELLQWGEKFRAAQLAARAAQATGLPRIPGTKQCRWCPIRDNCEARLKQIDEVFPTVEDVTPGKLSNEALAALLDKCELIDAIRKDLRAEVEMRCKSGADVPGWGIMIGREGNSAWTVSEAQIELLLGDMSYGQAPIISPTEARKRFKKFPEYKELIEGYIHRPPGKETLVRCAKGQPVSSIEEFPCANAD
jgi:hypothetical protein